MREISKGLLLLGCLISWSACQAAAPDQAAEPAQAAYPAQATEPAPKPLPPGRIEVHVKDLHCATCARKAARKLYAVRGVKKVKASLKQDRLTVFVPVDRPAPTVAVWAAVAAAGVEPVELRWADQKLNAETIKPLLAQRIGQRVAK